jgi:hypothetical protein
MDLDVFSRTAMSISSQSVPEDVLRALTEGLSAAFVTKSDVLRRLAGPDAFPIGKDVALFAPHRLFVLDRDVAIQREDLAGAREVGWRFVIGTAQSSLGEAWAIADVLRGGRMEARFAGLQFGSAAALLAQAVALCIRIAGPGLELRSLDVPSAYLRAMWLAPHRSLLKLQLGLWSKHQIVILDERTDADGDPDVLDEKKFVHYVRRQLKGRPDYIPTPDGGWVSDSGSAHPPEREDSSRLRLR